MSTPIENRGLGVFSEAPPGNETSLAVTLGNQPRGNTMADPVKTADKVDGLLKKADAEEAQARKDAEYGEMMDKILKCVDAAVCKRIDAWEAKQAKADAEAAEREAGDPKGVVADSDVENHGPGGGIDTEQPGANNMNDSVKVDSHGVPRNVYGDAVYRNGGTAHQAWHDEANNYQFKADQVYGITNRQAPRHSEGMSIRDYRIKLLDGLKSASAEYKNVDSNDFRTLPASVFEKVETQIYADAVRAGKCPTDVPEGTLTEWYSTDETGRKITNFSGESKAWLSAFAGERRRLVGIRNGS